MVRIGLIDYGAGNFTSVKNAMNHLGLPMVEVKTASELKECTHIILPGVGAFAATMRKLQATNIIDELKEQVQVRKKPFLGICVGMQVLASVGREFEDCLGLNFIEGTVEKINIKETNLRLPHIGWNDVQVVTTENPLFKNFTVPPHFYFIHSYHFRPKDLANIVATCDYGERLVAVIQRENIFGVQFHPEKSQHDGLQLLKNFSDI